MSETLVSRSAAEDDLASAPPAFVCELTRARFGAAWVHVAAELDIVTAPQLERTLRDAELRARLVVLDLRELTFMDSCGLHVITCAGIRAKRAGRRLVLVRGAVQVDRLFALSGASEEVEIVDLDDGEPAAQILLRLANLPAVAQSRRRVVA
jgi:anti-sigma B factor antagonist